MSCRKSSVCYVGVGVLGSLIALAAMSLPARAATYHMVDAQTNTGGMVLSGTGNNSGGQSTITLIASNTGTQTYNDVNLVFQFVWDAATAPETALGFTSSNSWAGSGDTFSVGSYSIGAGPSLSPIAFPHSNADTPLTWGGNLSQALATVQITDSFPAIPLGNFAPSATESFTLICPSNIAKADVVGFFVTVPEPSSIVLALFAGAGLLGYGWRRRSARG
jgi:hypothetical protein